MKELDMQHRETDRQKQVFDQHLGEVREKNLSLVAAATDLVCVFLFVSLGHITDVYMQESKNHRLREELEREQRMRSDSEQHCESLSAQVQDLHEELKNHRDVSSLPIVPFSVCMSVCV